MMKIPKQFLLTTTKIKAFSASQNLFHLSMPRDIIILECTEAKAEGVPTSRYVTTRNKKSLRTPGRLEKVKFNHFLKRRTLHRELR